MVVSRYVIKMCVSILRDNAASSGNKCDLYAVISYLFLSTLVCKYLYIDDFGRWTNPSCWRVPTFPWRSQLYHTLHDMGSERGSREKRLYRPFEGHGRHFDVPWECERCIWQKKKINDLINQHD